MTRTLAFILLGIGLVINACTRASESPPPISKGTTDPEFDWERPLAPGDSGNRSWLKVLSFKSTKSLEDTTRWLTWAIERYGHLKATVDTIDVSKVRFDHCTLRWFERRVGHINDREEGVTTESQFAVPLADVDLQLRAPLPSSEYIQFSLTNETEIVRRYFEKGQEKGTARAEHESSIVLSIRNEDHMADRIVWALVHASRLCGAKVKTDYDQ